MPELLEEERLEATPTIGAANPGDEWERGTKILQYALTIALSAFLLFQVQMILGKFLLPLFGGTPAVWTTCLLCFQVLLLLGYSYGHVLGSAKSWRLQGRVHAVLLLASLGLLGVLWVKWGSPLTPGGEWRPQPNDNPVAKILELLAVTVALPFFLLSTTGPLLQRWLSVSGGKRSPYRLYALSNAGSLLGLLSYPFLMEWSLTLKHQAWVWSSGYVAFAVLGTAIAWRQTDSNSGQDSPRLESTEYREDTLAPGKLRYLLWMGLSACSTTMLLASTNLLCQDIAVIPLLWVVPLSLYLVSFILTFDSNRWYRRKICWPLYFLVLGAAMKTTFNESHGETVFLIVLYCVTLFTVCLVCHGELARSKPEPRRLTGFYLMVALGGALGGAFVVLVAPHVFLGFWEFHVGLIGCGFLLTAAYALARRKPVADELPAAAGKPATAGRPGQEPEHGTWTVALIVLLAFLIPQLGRLIPNFDTWPMVNHEYYTGPLVVLCYLLWWAARRGKQNKTEIVEASKVEWKPVASLLLLGMFGIFAYSYTQLAGAHALFRERNFFGAKYVVDGVGTVMLVSGTTVHGFEYKDPAQRHTPTSYYQEESGVGRVLRDYPRGEAGRDQLRVGLIGMGAGTLAAYGRLGDVYRFYEIDPAVVALSAGAKPYFHFVEDSAARVDTVLGDARLSLEYEAERGELQKFDVLAVDAFSGDSIPVHLLTREATGVYLRHMRGRNGVLAFHVSNRYLNLDPVIVGLGQAYGLSAIEVRIQSSEWILLSANPEMFRLPDLAAIATPVKLPKKPVFWTDDYSNLLEVVGRPR
jgi:hypothetical protein